MRDDRESVETSNLGRRMLLGALGASACAALLPLPPARGQARALPLENLGLEHLDIVVPDPAESRALLQARVSSPLHEQDFRGGKRYFVLPRRSAARPASRLHRHRRGQRPADRRRALLRTRRIGGDSRHRQGARRCGVSSARRWLRLDPRSRRPRAPALRTACRPRSSGHSVHARGRGRRGARPARARACAARRERSRACAALLPLRCTAKTLKHQTPPLPGAFGSTSRGCTNRPRAGRGRREGALRELRHQVAPFDRAAAAAACRQPAPRSCRWRRR